ncbi:MAG TPA: protein kinase [Streptosporangiaceae bacterium]|nr:protein kinase [Streptosporangiaceae bacterium]
MTSPTVPGHLVAGRYRLVSALGSGGVGRVWLAQDELLGRAVAIKEFSPPAELGEAEREMLLQRSLREAKTAARLSHPNVVTIYDAVEDGGRPWIVMEMIPARSLRDLVRDHGPVEPHQAAGIGLQVLAALRAAHALGITHRDVKPANVLIDNTGRAVLADFGIAHTAGSPTLTRTGMLVGSPSYIAPERAHGDHGGPESDLWSLGATLYAVVEGRPPYDRVSPLATLTAVVNEAPDPPRRCGALWPVVSGLLTRDPAHRLTAAVAGEMLRQMAGPGPAWPAEGSPGTVPFAEVSREPDRPGTRELPLPFTVPDQPLPAEPSPAEPAQPSPPPAQAAQGVPASAEPGRDEPAHPAGAAQAVPAPAEPPQATPAQAEPGHGEPASAKPEPAGPRPAAPVLAAAGQGESAPAGPSAVSPVPVSAGPGPDQPAPDPQAPDPPSPDQPGQARPGPWRPWAGRSRRPWLIGGAAVAAVVAVIAAIVLALSTSPARHRPPQAGGSAATSRPTNASPAALPAGYHRYRDPTGFTIAVPPGWRISHQGRLVYLLPPVGGAFLLIDQSDHPKPDPLADWQQQEAARAGSYPGYHRIRLAAVSYPQAEKAADWEFTYYHRGVLTHVLNRNVLANAHHAYALYWSTPASQWTADRHLFANFARTFQPAR